MENEVNVTVLFPDNGDEMPAHGCFESHEAFRKFIFDNQNSRIQHAFHSRPTQNRRNDCAQDEFVRSFPLQFPFGYAGLPKQECLQSFMSSRSRKSPRIGENAMLRMFLRMRRAEFHSPDFNLAVNNMLMRHKVFSETRLQCNLRCEDAVNLGSKCGAMSGSELENSVNKVRAEMSTRANPATGDRFLGSIGAVCRQLPHSNDASQSARNDYFGMMSKFGLPALFVTMSPDDQRSHWVKASLMKSNTKLWEGEPSVSSFDDSDLTELCKERLRFRTTFPGLGAEECMAIVETFIRSVLCWDTETMQAHGIGSFGFAEAWTLATEEQGGKMLHGHFLVWIRGWNELLHRVMTRTGAHLKQDLQLMKEFVEHCSSARIFRDFDPDCVFDSKELFCHPRCRNRRSKTRFAVDPVPEERLLEMRRADKCCEHKGSVATCRSCGIEMSAQSVVENALNSCDGGTDLKFDRSKRRLEATVCEMQRDFGWARGPERKRARRLLFSNALSNTHKCTHSARCFKSSCTCCARPPAVPKQQTTVDFAPTATEWANWEGQLTRKTIFEVGLVRGIEDAFTNVHNPLLTMPFLCNNNVLAAMTGAAVLCVTGHNFKKTQKEERHAFERMAKALLSVMESQVRKNRAQTPFRNRSNR